ncbi:hypothetical protein HMPREF0765_2374 [Sphingobacterium spiritivorum ATCC 33300]|uniref:Thioesterase n=1 Tax=Sphingobacterium spiritivorum ATCC 33300 TaxID=525372 RepID=C2FYG8_SPHSI|nr:hypothetical protein [Sphingobacterium spiritivorum]EEI92050.1 hypothetical protein HMPREF0765_2374 [Sphingobacterium spiritivorum ATCC 33300]
MENTFYEGQVIWAQIDANRHMRHSAYADICAQARSNMLKKMVSLWISLLHRELDLSCSEKN